MTKSAFSECPACGEPMGEDCPCKPKMPSIRNLLAFTSELAERAEDTLPWVDGAQAEFLRTAIIEADEHIAAWQAYLNAGGKVVQGD